MLKAAKDKGGGRVGARIGSGGLIACKMLLN